MQILQSILVIVRLQNPWFWQRIVHTLGVSETLEDTGRCRHHCRPCRGTTMTTQKSNIEGKTRGRVICGTVAKPVTSALVLISAVQQDSLDWHQSGFWLPLSREPHQTVQTFEGTQQVSALTCKLPTRSTRKPATAAAGDAIRLAHLPLLSSSKDGVAKAKRCSNVLSADMPGTLGCHHKYDWRRTFLF